LARKFKRNRAIPFLLLLLLLLVLVAAYLMLVPDISGLVRENPRKTSFMEYREREWKREGKRYHIQQRWVPLSHISPYLMKAVLIAEDDKFWSHEGFDYDAIRKAIEKDLKEKKFKIGGSTISQQLVKNLYLSPEKNLLRKIREAVITWRMEKVLTKKRILELYLNIAEWGDRGIFGIEAASQHYYGKSALALNPLESARLAAILPNPRKYNPGAESGYVARRAALIYGIMVKRGIVSPEYEEIIREGETVHSEEEPASEVLRESPIVMPSEGGTSRSP